MSRASRSAGMTLVEMLVGAALMALLLGMFAAFLFPSMHYSAQGAARADIQQTAVLALDRIQRDLQESAIPGVALLPRAEADPVGDPVVLAMVPLKDVGADGQPDWKQEVVAYYWNRAGRLERRTWPPSPPETLAVTLVESRPTRLSRADLRTLALTPNGKESSVAGDVVSFDISDGDPGPGVASPLTLTLTVERRVTQQEKPEQFTLTRTLTLRNPG